MNDPKTFYRELDALLAKISKDISGKNFLGSIFMELEQKFGNELQIQDGCIYEKRDTDFILIFNSGKNNWVNEISIDSPAVETLLKHGSYIFDNTDIPKVMTAGGPEDKTRFIAMFIYDQAFQYQRLGYAAAVAWVLFLVIVGLTMLAFRISRERVYYASE